MTARIFGATLVAALAITGSAQAAGPALDALRVQDRTLTLTLSCSGRVTVQQATAACRQGRARSRITLSAAQHRGLRDGDTVRLRVRVSDRSGSGVLPLKLSLPVRRAVARASTAGYWPSVEGLYDGVQGQCIATDASDWSGQPGWRQVIIESNYAKFGYRYGTLLRWTAWVEIYDPATGVYSWFQGYTYGHTAGAGRGSSHVFTIANRPLYVRPAVQIVGGDWNYAFLGTVAGKAQPYNSYPAWCYMPRTA